MNWNTRLITPILLGVTLSAAATTQAQPAPRNGKGANPPAFALGGDWQNMTPQQRQEAMKQMVDKTLRDSLTHIGVDQATQDTVLQFADAQEKSKQMVRDKARKVSQALIDNAQPDAQMTALLNDLHAAVEDAKISKKADVAKLEELTSFSKKPKLEAFLTMMGLIGDDTMFLHGVFGNFVNSLSIMADPPVAPEKPKEN